MHRPPAALLALISLAVVVAPLMAMAIAEFAKSFKYKVPQPTLASAGTLVLKPDAGYVALVLTSCAATAAFVIIVFIYSVGTQEQGAAEFFLLQVSLLELYALMPLSYKVILESDAIILIRSFSTRRLGRQEIVGKTLFRSYFISSYTLHPKQCKKGKIKLPTWCDNYDEVRKWLNDIPWMGNPPPFLGHKL